MTGSMPNIIINQKARPVNSSKFPTSGSNQKDRPGPLIFFSLSDSPFFAFLSISFPSSEMASSSLSFLALHASFPSSSTLRSLPNPLLSTRFQHTNLKASSSRRLPYDAVVVTPDARAWVGSRYEQRENDELDYESEDEEENEEDRSLDLLVRFLHNCFKNISRKVRRAVRSVLPPSIPSKLVPYNFPYLKLL